MHLVCSCKAFATVKVARLSRTAVCFFARVLEICMARGLLLLAAPCESLLSAPHYSRQVVGRAAACSEELCCGKCPCCDCPCCIGPLLGHRLVALRGARPSDVSKRMLRLSPTDGHLLKCCSEGTAWRDAAVDSVTL